LQARSSVAETVTITWLKSVVRIHSHPPFFQKNADNKAINNLPKYPHGL
jgi:hypothetical protein